MGGDSIRVLCAGDLHIGRRSSKLPDSLAGSEHSCAVAWEAVVDTAISERVDVVALSGDLVDRANRYFEAIGPLERGLRRLAAGGIDTYAVAGNHDYDVLPELADTLDLDRFHLLGRGGRWERATVSRDNRPALYIDGWSFPREQVYECSLDTYDLPHDGVPVLGLLHADLDQAGSSYGPVTLAQLHRHEVAVWMLGHIHGCSIMADDGRPVVIYPGSPQAMDPGEPGVHGAIIADIDASGRVTTRRAPLSTVCYLPMTVDVSGIESDEDVRSRIVTSLREALDRDEHGYDRLACLVCRLTLTGRTPLHGALRAIVNEAADDLSLPGRAGVEAIIESIGIETRPAIDLDALARRNDPPGEVAKVIRALETGEARSRYAGLMDGTARELRGIHGSNSFAGISIDDPPEPGDTERLLLAEAWNLLDTLVAQKEEAV